MSRGLDGEGQVLRAGEIDRCEHIGDAKCLNDDGWKLLDLQIPGIAQRIIALILQYRDHSGNSRAQRLQRGFSQLYLRAALSHLRARRTFSLITHD
jgi:hypothetical protein